MGKTDRSLVQDQGTAAPARRKPQHKILSLKDAAAMAASLRRTGGTVVLAHGTFDLLHLGHARHLESAKQEGDYLFVTVTADAHVNKGPDRPVFNDTLRAEMLAALECVDFVAINHAASSENVIAQIKPAVYVKGPDYRQTSDDITGKINSEIEAVEQHGGRVLFTDDITFSSSNLINRHFNGLDPAIREYLEQHHGKKLQQRLFGLMEGVRDLKVLIVGETIIDQYDYVQGIGKPPKEHLVATLYKQRELFAGGVIAAANHVASLCGQVDILTGLGEIDSHQDVVRQALKPNVRLTPLMLPGRPTIRKVRYVDNSYMRKLFEVYHMNDAPMTTEVEDQLVDLLAERAANYDLVIVTDFGHGLLTRRAIEVLSDKARFLAVNTQSNSANFGYNVITRYPRTDYICIDAPEARLAVQEKHGDIVHVVRDLLASRLSCQKMVVTTGRDGCITFDRDKGLARIPAFTHTVVDTVGAGDAFFAVTAPLVATGGDMEEVGMIGNAAGAIKVSILGHRQSVEKVALMKYLATILK